MSGRRPQRPATPRGTGRRRVIQAGIAAAFLEGTAARAAAAATQADTPMTAATTTATATAATTATATATARRTSGTSPLTASQPFAFALIGDLPYSEGDALRAAAMIAQLDASALAFVLHVGDINSGREPCSDTLFERRRDLLARSMHPLVLLPGDNEWTDCHRSAAGAYDPRERLAALRALFWSSPGPLGSGPAARRANLSLERQPGAPENVVWRIGAVRFVAVHVVGSNNGLDGYRGSRAEFDTRERLNQSWLDAAVTRALHEEADALVIAAHANPEFGRSRERGFRSFLRALQDVSARFTRPILFLHGDSHRFRVDQPLEDRDGRPVTHFTRVECFGYPFTSSWVRIAYDPTHPERFRVGVHEVGQPPP
jgi:hypothetical protein